jgi:hypothetical protein
MAENIPVRHIVYDKSRFAKVVNTQFSELVSPPEIVEEFTIEDFFARYDELFFDIPNEGEINSHRYILNKEAEYLGFKLMDDTDVQALLQEITDLRQQLLETEAENIKLIRQISGNING